MPQNPTIPPVPKRPPAKPVRIPPITEKTGARSFHIDPYQGINKLHPVTPSVRHPSPSETDLEVVRHEEQIKGLERRLDGLEEVTSVIDSKMDKIADALAKSDNERALEKAVKEDAKVTEDQKTKRLQAILIAIPLILSPLLGFGASYLSKPTPDYRTNTVVVSEYTQAAADCKTRSKSAQEFVECVREAQLKNTPVFEK